MLGIAVTAALALGGAPAQAVDHLLPGKIVIIKPGPPPFFKILPKPGPVPITGITSPVVSGASLKLQEVGNPLNSLVVALPSGQWKGLGNPAGSKGYKYKGAGTPADPCKVVLIKEAIAKAVCKGGPSLTIPVPNPVAATLTIGTDRVCAEWGGTVIKNSPTIFKAKDAPAPPACS
jgi:hypothetical protein